MIEKKRSFGVTLFGIWMVLFSLFLLYPVFINFGRIKSFSPSRWFLLIAGIVYIISAYGIFRLKKWARILVLYFSTFIVIFCIVAIISVYVPYNAEARAFAFIAWYATLPMLVFTVPIIFFFTLPKVKDQFKKQLDV